MAQETDRPLLGIVCVFGAVACFSVQDTTIKWISGDYALHQIIFGRALVALLVTLLFVQWEGGWPLLRTRRPGLHLLRGLLVLLVNMCFFLSLARLPIAEAMTLFFVAPLIITVLSIPLLGERVGPWRWAGVVAGFIGVVVMLRPGLGVFEVAALLPLVAALVYALMQTVTRRLGVTDRASTMAFYMQLVFMVASLAIGLAIGDGRYSGSEHPSLAFLLRAWTWPNPGDAALIAGCGLLNAIGGYCLTQGYRVAEVGLVAPFEYAGIPLVMLWGFLLWGDLPDAAALAGIGLIVGSGLFVLYRERLTRRP